MIITDKGFFMYDETISFNASNYMGRSIWFVLLLEYRVNYTGTAFSILKSEALLVVE